MTITTGAEVTGTVKFYRSEDGWGRIELDDGTGNVFFHVSNLRCSPPYEGEEVVVDVVKSSAPGHEHDHEAMNVRRKDSAKRTGDILEWHVEPGTWQSRGLIAPEVGGDTFPFSARDFMEDRPKPRPWHAASFGIANTAIGRRAVDIELDTRYPLQRFAYLGKEDDLIADLKQLALEEEWDYRHSVGDRPSLILYNYLQFTFARLCDEDRRRPVQEKKIRVRDDLQPALATFNTGLVDSKYKSIYALFEENQPGHAQRWRFRAFCIPGEAHGKVLASYFNPLPGPAEYFNSTVELLYDPDQPLHLDYTHILSQNRDRLPAELLSQVKGMDESMTIRTLTMYVDQAVDVAKKRTRWNFRTAIPHYFPTFKRLEFLLPLCLLQDKRVDVALSVSKTDTGYLGNTILALDWAYKSARLVSRPDSDWLAPDQIDEAGKPAEDVEPA